MLKGNDNKMVKKICIGVSVALAIILFVIGIYIDKNSKFEGRTEGKDSALKVELIPIKDEQYLVNSIMVAWMKSNYDAEQLYNSYRNEFGRLDSPLPVTIKFNIENFSDNDPVSYISVLLSETESFKNAKKFELEIHKRELQIYNLKTGCKYYYRILVKTTKGNETVTESYFTTAESPRLIMVDGIRNVRDIGGFKTVDGKKVKQGLLFRGTELRGKVDSDFTVTNKGIEVLLNDLGIKNELDLRFPSDRGKPIGAGVEQEFYKFTFSYSEIFSENAKPFIKKLFSDFAIEETYPAYIHCTYGSDRTGTVCYLLQALLGLSETDCYKNWELTTFFNGGSYKKEALQFIEDVKKLDGNSLQQKTENFLMSTGVTKSEIENIKKIFLE